MMVACHFTENSKAKGCVVELKLVMDITLKTCYKKVFVNRLIQSRIASHCIQLPVKSYADSVTVKDWKIDGRTGVLSVNTVITSQISSPCEL